MTSISNSRHTRCKCDLCVKKAPCHIYVKECRIVKYIPDPCPRPCPRPCPKPSCPSPCPSPCPPKPCCQKVCCKRQERSPSPVRRSCSDIHLTSRR